MKKYCLEKNIATPADIAAYQKSSHGDNCIEAFNFLE